MTPADPPSNALDDTKKHEARWLAIGFVLVFVLIVADLVVRNIGDRYHDLWDFYVVWEASSIALTIVLTIFHWLKYINRGKGTAYTDVLATTNKRIHVVVFIGCLVEKISQPA